MLPNRERRTAAGELQPGLVFSVAQNRPTKKKTHRAPFRTVASAKQGSALANEAILCKADVLSDK